MVKENEISPIGGLPMEQFEKIREQIIQYIKMYHKDGEPIGAYKIMKLFEPFLEKKRLPFSEWVKGRTDELEKAGDGYDNLSELSKKCIDFAITRYINM